MRPLRLAVVWAVLGSLGLAGSPAAADPTEPALDRRPADTSAAMRQWVRSEALSRAPSHLPELERLRRLWRAMTGRGGLGLKEDIGSTVSAAEMFRRRRGDCVSFAHLFVALGRELGVGVFFVVSQEAEATEEVGELHEGGRLRVATRHLAAGWGSRSAPWVIDFGGFSRPQRGVRWIPDATAVAIFYSNLGVSALLRHRARQAVHHLGRAVELAPELPVAWVNLGVARRRIGDAEGAVEAYRRALMLEQGSMRRVDWPRTPCLRTALTEVKPPGGRMHGKSSQLQGGNANPKSPGVLSQAATSTSSTEEDGSGLRQ